MTGDSAFKRLFLDTVATTITQPPSTNALIELLRITTPSLQISNAKQRNKAYNKVRDTTQREKLFRTLQLRIHPDKHPGDEQVTALFQEATLFYQKCVEVMESEDRRQSIENDNCNIDATKSRAATRTTEAHGDYENVQYAKEQGGAPANANTRKRTTKSRTKAFTEPTAPSNHIVLAVISLIFPPLGALALYHSLKVRPSWKEGHFADARHHSERACSFAWWGLISALCIFLFVCLSDGDLNVDWDRMKRNFSWDNGP